MMPTWEAIQTILIPAIIVVAAYVGRRFLADLIANAVKHTFDVDLERIRSDLRSSEERLKADLVASEKRLSDVATGALSGLAQRNARLDERRQEAVEGLWAGIIFMGRFKGVAMQMTTIKFDAVCERIEHEPKLRQFIEVVSKPWNLDDLHTKMPDVATERPFVSEYAWALFQAYAAVIAGAVAQLQILRIGTDGRRFINTQGVIDTVSKALPEYSDYLKEQGPAAAYYLLEPLEQKLLEELRRSLSGAAEDADHVAKAAQIIRAAETAETRKVAGADEVPQDVRQIVEPPATQK